MAKNTKTPVMVLQELAVKRNSVPEYELIFSQQGTHKNTFHYKVTLLGQQAVGVGRSKKEAKHEAASKALELLAEQGVCHSDMMDEYFTPVEMCPDLTQMKAPLNCIPKLLDICTENRIPQARFIEISDVGPPHCREFTYECKISYITTRAIAGSKKHAKQLAAKEMLNKIIAILPELQQEMDQRTICNHEDEQVIRKFTTLSNLAPAKVNFNSKAIEYDLQFRKLMDDMFIKKEKVMKILEMPKSSDVLDKFVELFELEYELKTLQENPPIVFVNINSDTPVTVMAHEDSIENALQVVINKTISILKAFII